MFQAETIKIIRTFLSENFHFLVVKFSVYLNRHVFVILLSTDTTKSKIRNVSAEALRCNKASFNIQNDDANKSCFDIFHHENIPI